MEAPAPLESVLVVDDDEHLLRSISGCLAARIPIVHCCATLEGARSWLRDHAPSLVILDVVLPDGKAHDLLVELRETRRMPYVISVSGAASAAQAFRLAELGVCGYLEKPFTPDQLWAKIVEVIAIPPNPERLARELVGSVPLPEVEGTVRYAMIDEAMGRAGGSKRGAARLLGVTRQMLQQILRRRS